MNEQLATELLVCIMEWDDSRVAQERPYLEALAEYKYNEYQQFSPGMRFIESLATWLKQFGSSDERDIAYSFVKNRLIFFSAAEIAHFVSISYPDLIRPKLIHRAASILGVPATDIVHITNSQVFRMLQRQCLFLGLSDGARLDVFRRFNPQLSHDQVYRTHEVSEGRAQGLQTDLRGDLKNILDREPKPDEARFSTVVLIDDFTASGKSFLRDDGGVKKGKLQKWLESVREGGDLEPLIRADTLHVCVLFYVATSDAIHRLADEFASGLLEIFPKATHDVIAVQTLVDASHLSPGGDTEFLALVDSDAYYSPAVYDAHMAKGKGDGRRGFDEGLLPVVLTHNTPNNSVLLLWANPIELGSEVRGLFPRVSRHRANQ